MNDMSAMGRQGDELPEELGVGHANARQAGTAAGFAGGSSAGRLVGGSIDVNHGETERRVTHNLEWETHAVAGKSSKT